MRLIDSEMLLHSRRENARTTTPKSRASTMIFTKHRRELTTSQSWLTLKITNSERQMRLLSPQLLNSPEPRMTTLDLWLSPKLSRETSTVNSPRKPISKDRLTKRMEETESCNLLPLSVTPDWETLMNSLWFLERTKRTLDSVTIIWWIETRTSNLRLTPCSHIVTSFKVKTRTLMLSSRDSCRPMNKLEPPWTEEIESWT